MKRFSEIRVKILTTLALDNVTEKDHIQGRYDQPQQHGQQGLPADTNSFTTDVQVCTVELRLSGLIWTEIHTDKQRIRIIGFYFENRLHWQFEVRLLLFTVCTRV